MSRTFTQLVSPSGRHCSKVPEDGHTDAPQSTDIPRVKSDAVHPNTVIYSFNTASKSTYF
ncbi:hypothetical protein EXN66_Car019063 [Channa argus]|uniref:Uncharacterized protein n=1 Tax=Channa argus TaxID=215402 RepID=A0A6G1QLE8_CHAAH|nr:hypothetical protein EXN66_Car019063 [Channa argus]